MKSLFIIGIGRSGTSPLQRIATQMLPGFISVGETLVHDAHDPGNPLVRQYCIRKVPVVAPPQYWQRIKDHLLQFPEDTVIKDVIHGPFVMNNMEWILEHFNVIFLERPPGQIIACRHYRRWQYSSDFAAFGVKYRELARKHEGENCYILDYRDFIFTDGLIPILKRWYGKKFKPYDYTNDARFKRVRRHTLVRLACYLIVAHGHSGEQSAIHNLYYMLYKGLDADDEERLMNLYDEIVKLDDWFECYAPVEARQELAFVKPRKSVGQPWLYTMGKDT